MDYKVSWSSIHSEVRLRQPVWSSRSCMARLSSRRDWKWIHLVVDGTPFARIRKEIEIGIRCLSSTTNLHGSRRTLQFYSHYSHYSRTFALCVHGRQWSGLRYLSTKFRHRTPFLCQSQSSDRADCLVDYCLVAFRRRTQCGLEWISDESCSVPSNSFPISNLRTDYQR